MQQEVSMPCLSSSKPFFVCAFIFSYSCLLTCASFFQHQSLPTAALSHGADNVPMHVLQRMKKQCNPTKKKSFKERNPDLNLEEIQQNPNIPDEVKAVLKESVLTLDADDEEPAIIGDGEAPLLMSQLSPAELKTKKELLDYIDDGTGVWPHARLFTF